MDCYIWSLVESKDQRVRKVNLGCQGRMVLMEPTEKTVRMEKVYAATNTNSLRNATAEIMEYLRQSQNRANSLRANKQEKLNLSHFDFLKQSDMHLGMRSETVPTHSGG